MVILGTPNKEVGLQVYYDRLLEEAPYQPSIDRSRGIGLFIENGMTPEQIARLSVVFTRRPNIVDDGDKTPAYGEYIRHSTQIYLYCDQLWLDQSDANETFLHEAKHALLDLAPSTFMERHINDIRGFSLLGGMLVVGAEAISPVVVPQYFKIEQYLGVIFAGAITMSLGLIGNQLYDEPKARQFASVTNKDPRWKNIVNLTVRKQRFY